MKVKIVTAAAAGRAGGLGDLPEVACPGESVHPAGILQLSRQVALSRPSEFTEASIDHCAQGSRSQTHSGIGRAVVQQQIAAGAFGSAGERCMALPVALAVGDAAESLIAALRVEAEKIVVGPGDRDGVDMGPVISADARRRASTPPPLAPTPSSTDPR